MDPHQAADVEPATASSGHGRTFLRQSVGVSLLFWTVASIGALIAWLRFDEPQPFLHYLRVSGFILFGLVLFGGSTLANRITTVHGDKWGLNMGRYGHEEEYGDRGGLTAIGMTTVLVPQIAAVAYLLD